MERTVKKFNLEAVKRIATEDTALHGVFKAFLNRGNEFLGDITAGHLVLELQATFLEVFVHGTHVHDDVSELTTTTGLLLVNLAEVDSLGDGFFVVHLRLALVTFHLELALQTVDDDVEVKFTHTGDDCLTALFVSLDGEGRVFFSQLGETLRKFVEVFLSFGFYGDTDNGIGEVHGLEYDGCIFVAKRVTGVNVFETYACTDVTGADDFNGVLVVGVHLEQTGNTFLLARAYVVDIRTGFHFTGIHAEESQTTNIGVGSNLEREGCGLFVFAGLAVLFFAGIGVGTNDGGSVKRGGQEHADIVKQGLNALVLEGRTASHGNDVKCEGSLTNGSNDFFFGETVRILKVFFHEGFVLLSSEFNHFATPFFALVFEFGGNLFHVVFSAHSLIVPEDGFHADEVHDALELLFSTDGHGDDTGSCTEDVFHLTNYFKEVCAGAVHLVDVTDTRHIVFVCLTPNGLRLRFHTTDCTVGSHGTVKHTKRTFHLSGEVHVSRSINQIELILISVPSPVGGSCSGGDGDTAFLFLRHPVHGCATVVHFTNFVSFTGVEEDTFGSGGFTGIDVRHDTDVTSQV